MCIFFLLKTGILYLMKINVVLKNFYIMGSTPLLLSTIIPQTCGNKK